ncbi:MAG TPA: hypothetical protein PL070_11320 [Flavobacteriales bacterium]|nr:hypothetical protein [Flavobacteriales bacterium]
MAMERVSGTIWERCSQGHIWVGVPVALFFVVNGVQVGGALFFMLIVGLLFSGIDSYVYSKYRLAIVYVGDHLLVNGVHVYTQDVVWMREIQLRALKNSWTFVEVVFLRDGEEVRVLCMGKPDRLFGLENRTIRMILKKLPELKDRIVPEERTHHIEGVNELPRPLMSNEETEFPVDPMARYRDPYFRRKR